MLDFCFFRLLFYGGCVWGLGLWELDLLFGIWADLFGFGIWYFEFAVWGVGFGIWDLRRFEEI